MNINFTNHRFFNYQLIDYLSPFTILQSIIHNETSGSESKKHPRLDKRTRDRLRAKDGDREKEERHEELVAKPVNKFDTESF